MTKTEFCLYYVTFPDQKTADRICRSLLEKKLIACCNLLPGAISQYWWQGKIESSQEVIGILKSQKCHKSSIQQLLQTEHPYENFCLLQIDVDGGAENYLAWLKTESTPQSI